MGRRGPKPTPLRNHVISLYVRGLLATLQDGAIVAGVTKARVRAWLKASGLNWQQSRLRFLARQRRKAVLVAEGKWVARPSKKWMRRQAEIAKTEWDKRQEKANGAHELGAVGPTLAHESARNGSGGTARRN